MNANQYANYQKHVAGFLRSNDVQPGCYGPENMDAEPFFSWHPCECCGSGLGGDRERYNFALNDGDKISADICTDCVYYLACGRLDDSTMMEIEQTT